jgi:hypothetical protein
MSEKKWQAVIRVQVSGGGQSWNGSNYQANTTPQIVSIESRDMGGFFATKAQLESAYGPGSVQSLIEK